MDAIDKLFDTLDKFRHQPAYQLERRADIFFTLFLKEALESKLGCTLREEIIPEFPLKREGMAARFEPRAASGRMRMSFLQGGLALRLELVLSLTKCSGQAPTE